MKVKEAGLTHIGGFLGMVLKERLAQILSVPASTLFRSAIRTRQQPEEKIVSQPEV